MTKKQKKWLVRIIVAGVLYVMALFIPLSSFIKEPYNVYATLAVFLIPYLIAGYDVLLKAAKNIRHGKIFDENFLMSIATLGAFALVLFPHAEQHFSESAAVMLFYQIGELFQSYAVGKSRNSITEMMDIAPDFANKEIDGALVQLDPESIAIGDEIIIKPGERIPLDGVVVEGASQLETSALTGESMPRKIQTGDDVISGCVNMTGRLKVRVTKVSSESTVSRILELVENATDKKARTETFITRFARYYTPIVVAIAVLLAICPPLFAGLDFSDWIERGLIFLVVSCPCALVISIPLSFFSGIGGASRKGILIKGSNYLETLASVATMVFDKTGTLTTGTFQVISVDPEPGATQEEILSIAAHAEAFSDHPIATSIKEAFSGTIDQSSIKDETEESGHGIRANIDGSEVCIGNAKLMDECHIEYCECKDPGTVIYVAKDAQYLGHIVIADTLKPDSKQAIKDIKRAGVKRCVMLTGDKLNVAENVAKILSLDEYHSQLLPADKVSELERLLDETHANKKDSLAFVGDGINDAPVLTRADIGIAMGALGSDAAIEAADIVLMNDKPSKIASAILLSRKTMHIVYENITFALSAKIIVLLLAAVGIATMWFAVFADVGVAILAILNAMRAFRISEQD